MAKTLTCTHCEQPFRAGAWLGCEGNPALKHKVESKTYYSMSDRLQVNAIPQTNMVGGQGERINIPGVIVTFFNGTFSTTDPEIQSVLDVRVPMKKEDWIEGRMTPELKSGRQRAVILEQQDLIRQLKERNEALEAAIKAGAKPESEAKDPVMAGAQGRRRNRAA